LLRRGIKIECLHFASPPYTSEAVLDKLKDLLDVMNAYQERIKLNVAPFTKIQESIYKYVDEPYCITVMRRMMMRIAERVAKKTNCKAIATGESIGQVASQTLDSMVTINNVTNYPIIRPLAVEDKVKIINTAKRIGTFEISIRPYEDCCTIFKPKKPKTRPKSSECEYYESLFDWKTLLDECVENVNAIMIKDGEEVDFENK
jgi:thiamine biosynthesis protein ThiI